MSKRKMRRLHVIVGRAAECVAMVVALGVAYVGVRSVPDGLRYLRMRRM